MPEGFIYNSGQVLAEIVQKLIYFEKNINIRGPIAKTNTKQSNFDVSVDHPLILSNMHLGYQRNEQYLSVHPVLIRPANILNDLRFHYYKKT